MIVEDNTFNLTDNSHYKKVRGLADNFIMQELTFDKLWLIAGESKLFPSLAAFLAISKKKLALHKNKKLRIAILMNLIHEHNRLRPSSDTNPNGENSLENKIDQLNWLLQDTEIEYRLIYVSGNCPWGSDEIMDSEIKRLNADSIIHIKVDDYKIGDSYTKNQKGGEMIFGIRSILQMEGYPDMGHFDCMLFTDADMTFDLGQIGILIDGYYSGMDLITGNRMDPQSILIKNMTRAGSGVLMYRHLQRKLAPGFFIDKNLHDTQCPWKFLSHKVLNDIEGNLDCMDWSIDTDILSAAGKHGYSLNIVPVTAIDSEFESHGKAIGHFRRNRTIIEGTLHQAEKYNLKYDKDIANLVYKYLITDEDYQKLLESGLPLSLSYLPNEDWGMSDQITLTLVETWLKDLNKKIDL